MCRNKHTRKFIKAKTSIMDPRGIYVLKIADRASKPSPNNRNGVIRCNLKHYIHETGCIEELELDSVHPLYLWKGKTAIYYRLLFFFVICNVGIICMAWYHQTWFETCSLSSVYTHLLGIVNPLSSLPPLSHITLTQLFLTTCLIQGQKLPPMPVLLQSNSLRSS